MQTLQPSQQLIKNELYKVQNYNFIEDNLE